MACSKTRVVHATGREPTSELRVNHVALRAAGAVACRTNHAMPLPDCTVLRVAHVVALLAAMRALVVHAAGAVLAASVALVNHEAAARFGARTLRANHVTGRVAVMRTQDRHVIGFDAAT